MAKLTTEELLENEDLVDALFKYGNRQNKNYITKEDALEDFLGEYRGVQANTAFAVAFANDIDNIRSDEDRLQFGRLYKAVDEDLEDFADNLDGEGKQMFRSECWAIKVGAWVESKQDKGSRVKAELEFIEPQEAIR